MTRIILTALLVIATLLGQTQVSTFKSLKYNYLINKPSGFDYKTATGTHIDYKVVSKDGSSITVNVSKRLPEEKGIDAHSYTKDYFETVFKKAAVKMTVLETEKIVINKIKTFLVYYTFASNDGNKLKAIGAYLFVGDNAYLSTTTSDQQHYDTYRTVFLQTIKSITF